MHSIQDDNNSAATAGPILSITQLQIALAAQPKQILLQSLSLQLHAGETLAIVGESGSAKSLTALAILGLLPPTLSCQGRIDYRGKNLLTASDRALLALRGRKIALILQEPMTALNALHRVEKILAQSWALAGYAKASWRQRSLDILHEVGIEDAEQKLRCYPFELSGGQRQRLMIAAAIALAPDILIADEPTTALDVSLQQQILELLQRLQQQRGMAIILISHDLNLIRRYAQQVVVLKKGQVMEQGSVSDIFQHAQSDYTQQLLHADFGQAQPYLAHAETLLCVNALQVDYQLKSGWLQQHKQQFTALHALNFQLPVGSCLGVVGESGSGKTTLAQALVRLLPSQGQMVFLGQDLNLLSNQKLSPIRRKMQMVFQDPFASLNPRMRVYDIIAEGLCCLQLARSLVQEKVLQALSAVDLAASFAERYPHQLSGGQRQRVALARAIILRPQLLILDEPTSALDRVTQIAILALLRRLQQQYQMSYIFISHDLQQVQAICQQVLVLKQGQVVEYGRTAQVFQQPQHHYTQQLLAAHQLSQSTS
ncbi:dipeptide ABC transporter ATP-binding protein [Acinetobacter larvae]|uniref:Microcin ABC transporter ATP-binding protein n=1 Tax=Acinetobacter larvae TaxID=1789224 RepID=A0A1B2M1J0_9GAMM|nr:dipeptide ABC transporter ATP-binding protein [Acinetobacter larvae]AOA58883.1 microcin ABC transporter ATP-binding protein [Acinetobacter larvae]